MDGPDARLGRSIAQVLREPGLPDSRLTYYDQRSAAGVAAQPAHSVPDQGYRCLPADKNRTTHTLILPGSTFPGSAQLI